MSLWHQGHFAQHSRALPDLVNQRNLHLGVPWSRCIGDEIEIRDRPSERFGGTLVLVGESVPPAPGVRGFAQG